MDNNIQKDIDRLSLKGTTTVGIVCNDGVIFGTDTRVTMGYFVAHKKGKKVYPIDKHLAITIAGTVADAQNVVEILKANANIFKLIHNRQMPVSSISRVAANILFSSRIYPLALQAIIGGFDELGPSIYSIDPFGSMTKEECFSTGSGSLIAFGVLEEGYKNGLNISEGISLVIKAVTTAMKRDIGSGDSFDIASITKKGYEELSEEEKKKFL